MPPICENIKQPYRSFKNFDVNAYVNDLDKICLLNESCDNVTDIDIEYDHPPIHLSKKYVLTDLFFQFCNKVALFSVCLPCFVCMVFFKFIS
jgi:hypothetical protein